MISDERERIFAGMGAALGLGDLDNDADIDIVLGNLDAPATILWNEGQLAFRKQELAVDNARGVNTVDVDGDGWLDIVLTHPGHPASLWRNSATVAAVEFERAERFGAWHALNAMAWADLDRDGDLDMVGASYDGELARLYGGRVVGGGVAYYENAGGTLTPTELERTAQALALLLTDVNGDERLDILVGNDFDWPDRVWLWSPRGWIAANPFAQTARNTMSLDAGDIDNDGNLELFAADMKPYADNASTREAWRKLREEHEPVPADDPQIGENVLQVRDSTGSFGNRARASGVDASGWSWSAKFADLDNDGFLDLYVVNGMYSEREFGHLPGAELVEENLAFRNDGGVGTFTRADDWGLDSTIGGRGMSVADLDRDGDLDIVVNNLNAPAKLFENRLCGGSSLQVDLIWPGSGNSRAIGSRLALHASTGSYLRETRSSSGYLSGDPNRTHFGFPAAAKLDRLEIVWPDGARSTVPMPMANSVLTVTRTP